MAHRKFHSSPLAEKLATWLIFGVIVALAPFIVNFLFLLGQESVKAMGLQDIFGGGELLIVSTVIAAGAVGEVALVDVPRARRLPKVFAIGGCTITILLSSSWFGIVSSTIHDKHLSRPTTVAIGSVYVFAVALVCSASCIVISQMSSETAKEIGEMQWVATLVRLIQEADEEQ